MRSYVAPVMEAPASETLSLISVINFFLRNIGIMIAGGIVFAVLLAIPSMMRAPRYTATTTFITEGEQPAGRLLLGGISLPATGGKGPEFYVELMQSPAILGPLVATKVEADPGKPALTLMERYAAGEKREQVATTTAIGAVQSRMSTKISLNGIITLRVWAEDPHLAAGIAKGILQQVDEFNNNKRRLQASAERRFMEQRLVEVRAEVTEAEDRYRTFLERNREVKSPALQIELQHLSDELSMRRAQLSSIVQANERAKMDEIRDSPRATVLQEPLAPTGPDPRSTPRWAVLGFFFGVMVAGFLALAKEYFTRIPKQTSPEASEFTALTAASTQRLRRPFTAILSAVRKPQHPNTVS